MTDMASLKPRSAGKILRDAHDWRLRVNSPEATDSDRAAFEDWRRADPQHADIYDQAVTFWSALGHLSKDDLDDTLLRPTWRERMSAAAVSLTTPFTSFKGRITAGATALAACAVLFIVIGNAPFSTFAPIETAEPVSIRYSSAVGENKAIILDDGTRVTLGPASAIEAVYSGQARTVQFISGAALFDVVSDPERPFSVYADSLIATALGTAFEVRTAAGVMRVAVAEGAVAVRYPLIVNGKPTALETKKSLVAGQQVAATLSQGMEPVTPIDVAHVGAWRNDRLIYNGATLAELVSDANRYSTTPIEIAEDAHAVAGLKVRGAFNARDIDGMLSVLEEIHPVIIERDDDKVTRLRAKSSEND